MTSADRQALERIMLLPPAVMSLVHRNHFLTWLETQWMLSDSSPTRGVEEERGRYLSILDSAVIVLASRDKDKSARLAAKAIMEENEDEERKDDEEAEADDPAEDDTVEKEWSLKNREWAGSVERLVRAAAESAGE